MTTPAVARSPEDAPPKPGDTGQYGDWFLLEGRISDFRWAASREDLLQSVREKSQLKTHGPLLVAAATDSFAGLANTSMLVMYDGEDTQVFACKLGEQAAFGQFEGAKLLRNGDQVQAIVSKRDDLLQVHAIMRRADELLWLPGGVYCGDAAARKAAVRSSIVATIVSSALIAIVALGFAALDERVKLWHALVVALAAPFGVAAITLLAEWAPGRVGKEFGEMGSVIFRMFGFPDPDNLDMQLASLQFQTDQRQVGKVYMYRLALDAQASGQEIETRFDRAIDRIKQDQAASRKRSKGGNGSRSSTLPQSGSRR